MARSTSPSFRCTECGWTSLKWVGRCGECQRWGTVVDVTSALVSARGTAPVTVRSGKTVRVRFRRACNKQARNTVQQLAQQLIRHHDWAREIYQAHRDRGRHHHEALRIVAHHALRVLFAM